MTTITISHDDDLILTEDERVEILAKREKEEQKREIKELWEALNKKMIEYGWHWEAHLNDNGYWSYGSHRANSVSFYGETISLNIPR